MAIQRKSRIYPLHANAALVITPYMAAYVALAYDRERGSVPAEIQSVLDRGGFDLMAEMNRLPCGYHDLGLTAMVLSDWGVRHESYASVYAGMKTEFPSMTDKPVEQVVEDAPLTLIRPDRPFEAFHAAYGNADEMLDEFRAKLHDCMPSGFDWWRHVMNVMGQHVEPVLELEGLLDFLK